MVTNRNQNDVHVVTDNSFEVYWPLGLRPYVGHSPIRGELTYIVCSVSRTPPAYCRAKADAGLVRRESCGVRCE